MSRRHRSDVVASADEPATDPQDPTYGLGDSPEPPKEAVIGHAESFRDEKIAAVNKMIDDIFGDAPMYGHPGIRDVSFAQILKNRLEQFHAVDMKLARHYKNRTRVETSLTRDNVLTKDTLQPWTLHFEFKLSDIDVFKDMWERLVARTESQRGLFQALSEEMSRDRPMRPQSEQVEALIRRC